MGDNIGRTAEQRDNQFFFHLREYSENRVK